MRVSDLLRFIKVEHSVFALPFVYAGVLLGWHLQADPCLHLLCVGMPLPPLSTLLLATTAAVGARGAAMALNRIIDRDIDARNPRTRNRELPTGRISTGIATLVAGGSLVLLFVSAYLLNPLVLLLSPILIPLFVFYPYTKRFTVMSHLILGAILGIAPVGGWLAVTGSLDLPTMVLPLLLWVAVGSWVAGFDIIYALDDVAFDRKERLYSIPARYGIRTALIVSYSLHVLTVIALVAVGYVAGLGLLYFIVLIPLTAVLVYEHTRVDNIQVAFFYANGIVGGLALLAVALGIFLPMGGG